MIAARRSPTLASLAREVVDVDVATGVGGDDDHVETGHHGAGGVRAVGAGGDQAHRALVVTAGAVVGADRQQPGELALAPGVGLHADGVVAGDLGQPLLQLADQRPQPGGVVGGREGVQVGELRPRDRHHLRRRVELHRARAERDHRAVEGEVAVGEPAQVAQHLVLGVVAVEHRLGEDLVRRAAGRSEGRRGTRRRGSRSSDGPERRQHLSTRSSVDVSSKVRPTAWSSTRRRSTPTARARGEHGVGVDAVDGDGVEPRLVAHAQPGGARARRP